MELELTRMFVKVVQHNSFTKAADFLQVPKSTISKAVSRLEKETGTKLLMRTTRSLTLTAAGRAFYDASMGPVQALEDAQKSLYGKDSIMSGTIKLTAPEDLGSAVIADAIAEISKKHSNLRFELIYTDEVLDLIKDGFDMAVRIGRLNESTFKVKKLGEVVLIPVAAPRYMKGREKIRKPKDLENHDCISYRDQSLSSRWPLRSKHESVNINLRPRISSNQMTSLLKIAIAGAGIGFVPEYLCRAYLEAGTLISVLPGWSSPGLQVSLISPLPVSSSARLKITAEEISKVVQDLLAGS